MKNKSLKITALTLLFALLISVISGCAQTVQPADTTPPIDTGDTTPAPTEQVSVSTSEHGYTGVAFKDIPDLQKIQYTILTTFETGIVYKDPLDMVDYGHLPCEIMYVSPDESEIILKNSSWKQNFMIFKDGELERVVEYNDENWKTVQDELLKGKEKYKSNLSLSHETLSTDGKNLIYPHSLYVGSSDVRIFDEYTVHDYNNGRTWHLKDFLIPHNAGPGIAIADTEDNLYLMYNDTTVFKFDSEGKPKGFLYLPDFSRFATEIGPTSFSDPVYTSFFNPETGALYFVAHTQYSTHIQVVRVEFYTDYTLGP